MTPPIYYMVIDEFFGGGEGQSIAVSPTLKNRKSGFKTGVHMNRSDI